MAVTLRCGITQNSQNVTNNTSNVTAWIDAVSTGGSYNHLNPGGTVQFGGNASGRYNFNHNFNANTTTRIYTRTFNVTHNADGTGKVTMSGQFVTNVSSGTVYCSATKTLTTIPRASTPTVTGTKQLGSKMTINTNRASSAFTHTLKWSWAGKSGTIGTGVTTSKTWTPSISTFAPYLTNATSSTCTITCDTYNGSTKIGSKTTSFTLSIPSSVIPTVSDISPSDSTDYYSTFGAYVQNKSIVKVGIDSAGIYGSSIKSRIARFSYNSEWATGALPINIGIPNRSGTVTIQAQVMDTRSRNSATKSETISVAAYSVPSLSGTSAMRYNTTTDMEDDESTTVRVHVVGSATNVNNANLNSATVTIKYKLHSSETWTTAESREGGYSWNYNFDISNISESSSYDIQVVATDQIGGTATWTGQIGTATPVMDFKADGEGVAFFAISDKPGVKIGSTSVTLKNNADIDFENADGTSYTAITNADGIPVVKRTSVYNGPALYFNQDFKNLYFKNDSGANQKIISKYSNDTVGRLRFDQHVIMANAQWIQGQLTSGSLVNILRMNTSNRVELNWTSGGVRGRHDKKLWSGTWSHNSSVTLSELPYYNALKIYYAQTSSQGASPETAVVYRSLVSSHMLDDYERFRGGTSNSSSAAYNRLYVSAFDFQVMSATSLKFISGYQIQVNGNTIAANWQNIVIKEIWGIM